MPVYTYRCGNCGNQFERQQSYDDSPLKTCPNCKKKALKKVITPAGVVFKGSGFYANDHKSSSGSSSHASKKDEPASSETKSEGKSETKSEGKSESKPEKKSESKSESRASAGSKTHAERERGSF